VKAPRRLWTVAASLYALLTLGILVYLIVATVWSGIPGLGIAAVLWTVGRFYRLDGRFGLRATGNRAM
jgi:hypothetical protein